MRQKNTQKRAEKVDKPKPRSGKPDRNHPWNRDNRLVFQALRKR